MQDLVNLQETKKTLEADREKLLKELQELQNGLAPLQEALKGKQEAKNETVKKYRFVDLLIITWLLKINRKWNSWSEYMITFSAHYVRKLAQLPY